MLVRRLATTLTALCMLLWASSLWAQAFETRASAAFVLDQTTGTVLLSKNADVPLPPASMSKLMTLYMAFEAVADGRLDIDERLPVSQHAMDYGGSSMFLRAGETVRVEDLIRGIIVLSGNDASTVIAEALSPDGTEAGFARLMTERAQQLGMNHSTFVNSNGWPADGHRMSMHDLGILAAHIIHDYPTFYPIFSEQEFLFDGRVPANTQNRNPILSLGIGADGLKTGHTTEAGYGLVGSAKQGDRRIIFVITGLDSAAARAEEGSKIINWAFRQFAQRDVAKAGTQLATADVWMGAETTVGLTVADDLSLLMPSLAQNDIPAQVVYSGPVEAPIVAGQPLGELVIQFEGLPETRVPLVAANAVARGGFGVRMRTAVEVLMEKFGPTAAPAAAPQADPATNGNT
jgi:D-alanyl-D-alanine carboxypeptidase (penicillin-binding protein 5/6)